MYWMLYMCISKSIFHSCAERKVDGKLADKWKYDRKVDEWRNERTSKTQPNYSHFCEYKLIMSHYSNADALFILSLCLRSVPKRKIEWAHWTTTNKQINGENSWDKNPKVSSVEKVKHTNFMRIILADERNKTNANVLCVFGMVTISKW